MHNLQTEVRAISEMFESTRFPESSTGELHLKKWTQHHQQGKDLRIHATVLDRSERIKVFSAIV